MLLEKYTLAEIRATCEDIRMGKKPPDDEHGQSLYKSLSKYFGTSYAQYLECEIVDKHGEILETIRSPLTIEKDMNELQDKVLASHPENAVEATISVSYDKDGKDKMIARLFPI